MSCPIDQTGMCSIVVPAGSARIHPRTQEGWPRGAAHAQEQPIRYLLCMWVDTAVRSCIVTPGPRTTLELRCVSELAAAETIAVDIDDDRVAVFNQRDWSAEKRLWRHVSDDEADRSTREATVCHKPNRDLPLPAEG